MEQIQELIDYMYLIIPIGCCVKVIILLIQQHFDENKEAYKKRFINTLTFFIIALSLNGVVDIITYYIGSL